MCIRDSGLDGALQGLKISEILAMIRMEIVNMKDWEVFDDVYVAAFSFARYQMWQDLRRNMDVFSKNELISSLLNNRCEIKDVKDVEFKEDECPPTQTLMPLPADSSQWEACLLYTSEILPQRTGAGRLHRKAGRGRKRRHGIELSPPHGQTLSLIHI